MFEMFAEPLPRLLQHTRKQLRRLHIGTPPTLHATIVASLVTSRRIATNLTSATALPEASRTVLQRRARAGARAREKARAKERTLESLLCRKQRQPLHLRQLRPRQPSRLQQQQFQLQHPLRRRKAARSQTFNVEAKQQQQLQQPCLLQQLHQQMAR